MGQSLIILVFFSQLYFSYCGRFDSSFNMHYETEYSTAPAIYPYSDLGCVRNLDWEFSFFHCENRVTVNMKRRHHIEIKCFSSVKSSEIEFDYLQLLQLSKNGRYYLHLIDCPEPRHSYGANIFTDGIHLTNQRESLAGNVSYSITVLIINCKKRKTFSISNKHLQGLSQLLDLDIRCSVLSSLPSDLFQGTTTEIVSVHISNTRVKYIPNRLFYNLKKLSMVSLVNNLIKKIYSDAFLDCKTLSTLHIFRNQLDYLEDNLLETTDKLSTLVISRNNLKEMPKNLHKTAELTKLDLSQNLINRIGFEHCEGLTNVRQLNVSYNRIAHIDQNCFSKMPYLNIIDLSGNSLMKLTGNAVTLKNLKEFYFNDNLDHHFEVEKFFEANFLLKFHMRNSNAISLAIEAFRSFAKLEHLDLSMNDISTIPDDLFHDNRHLKVIHLQNNAIISLPMHIFSKNSQIQYANLSSNRLEALPPNLFSQTKNIFSIDISFNSITNIPFGFLSNLTVLKTLKMSSNNFQSVDKDFLLGMVNLTHLDLSNNQLDKFPKDIFLPLKDGGLLRRLEIQGNILLELPELELPNLDYLDVSRNNLETIPNGAFHKLPKLKTLLLSNNKLSTLTYNIVTNSQILETLDLSHNRLRSISNYMLKEAQNLISINFSYNNMTSFDICLLIHSPNLKYLNLSSNRIVNFLYSDRALFFFHKFKFTSLKVLDLSNNEIDMNYSPSVYEEQSATWGRVSPFQYFTHLEVLLLSNNHVTTIFLDWRINMPDLRFIDLKHNKLQYLTHQDMLFSTTEIHEHLEFGPYPCNQNLTVDLRNNEIRFVELPPRMLKKLPKGNETRGIYGNVKMLIDDNPLECGCAIFNLLRVLRYDVVLESEIKRNRRGNWMLPAKLEIGNLACSKPKSIRGKKLNATDEWIHHLLPMFGLCSLAGPK